MLENRVSASASHATVDSSAKLNALKSVNELSPLAVVTVVISLAAAGDSLTGVTLSGAATGGED